MKLFDALRASPVGCAMRDPCWDHLLPNVALLDGDKPKAFRAPGNHGWERRSLRGAMRRTDWWPSSTREYPFKRVDVVSTLGGLADDPDA